MTQPSKIIIDNFKRLVATRLSAEHHVREPAVVVRVAKPISRKRQGAARRGNKTREIAIAGSMALSIPPAALNDVASMAAAARSSK